MTERLDPWGSVEIKDYEHVFQEFGMVKLSEKLKLDHYLFKRGIIVAHRDFEKVYARIKAKKPFIQMTGIASSGPLHFGHKIDLDLFVYLQGKGAKNYFAVCDIDAYTSRAKINSIEEAKKYAVSNLAHALALGVKPENVYVQSKMDSRYYTFAFEISKKITENMFKAVYGHLDLGKASAVILQIGDILHGQLKEYSGKMPSVTGIGLDQDPHAKITRDLSRRLGYDLEVPSFLYFRHQSGLKQGNKMSSSEPDTAIFLDDNSSEVKRKISKGFTGGRDSLEEQKKLGGRPEICKVYEMQLFHNPDNKEVEKVFKDCKGGKLLCGECKQKCIKFVNGFLAKHQKKVKENLKIAEKIVFG